MKPMKCSTGSQPVGAGWRAGATFALLSIATAALPTTLTGIVHDPAGKPQAEAFVTAHNAARKMAVSVLTDFHKLFPGSNVAPLEVHIYRRGHPMYMSTPGLFTQTQPLVRLPLDRIFFANTDSEGPVSSTGGAITAAQRAIKEVEHRLARKPPRKHQEIATVAG